MNASALWRDQVAGAVRRVWADALPPLLLDLWWSQGDYDRVFAVLRSRTEFGAAPLLAWYAGRDPEQGSTRCLRAARQALSSARYASDNERDTVLALVPLVEDRQLRPLGWRQPVLLLRRSMAGDPSAEIDPSAVETMTDTVAGQCVSAVWLFRNGEAARAHAQHEKAWANFRGGSLGVELRLLAQTATELDAWDKVPKQGEALDTLGLIAATAGRTAGVNALLRERTGATWKTLILAGALLEVTPPPEPWREIVMSVRAEEVEDEHQEGLLTDADRWALDVARAFCAEDPTSALQAVAVAAMQGAHGAAQVWAEATARRFTSSRDDARIETLLAKTPPLIEQIREQRATAFHVSRPARQVGRIIRAIGDAGGHGELRSVALAIEGAIGRTLASKGGYVDDEIEILAETEGRSQEAAAQLEGSLRPPARLIAGLARDGHLDRARALLARALAEPVGTYDLELLPTALGLLEPVESAPSRELLEWAVSSLPGSSEENARQWLAPAEFRDGRHAHAANPAMEAAILADPDAPDAYLVYGDWLQGQGDPLGEFVAVQGAFAANPTNTRLKVESDELLRAHEDTWLGEPLTKLAHRGELTCTWRYGFLHAVAMGGDEHGEGAAAEAFEALATTRVGRFLRDLEINVFEGATGNPDYQPLIDAMLTHGVPRTLRRLVFDVKRFQLSFSHLGDLSALYPQLYRLEELRIKIGRMTLGRVDLPALKTLEIITGGLDRATLGGVSGARWPALETLVLYFGQPNYGGDCTVEDLAVLLSGAPIPRVKHLALCNAPFQDTIARAMVESKILPQLRTLDLSQGMMGDDGALAILDNAKAFAHLETLVLSKNFIPFALADRLAAAFGARVVLDEQDEETAAAERYVQISE